jgi:multidrug efflux system outer membrane protein
VGPNYHRQAPEIPAAFRAQAAAENASLADLAWYDLFKDDTLKDLVRTALENNYDLRIATARLEQAAAIAQQARSALIPQIGYQGIAARGKNSFLGSPSPNLGTTNNAYFAAFTASWEVDLWGKLRRLDESARAQYLASEEGRRAVAITLVSAVAQSYFQLLALDEDLVIAKRTQDSFQKSLDIFTQRLERGIASRLETSRGQAALSEVAAQVPDIEGQIQIQENEINILLGRAPGPVPRKSTLIQQTMPEQVPAGLPSALLERRPDIRQAEEFVRAANANVGATIGNFLPNISLTSLFGGVSPELSKLTAQDNQDWSVASTLSGPIFTGGLLTGELRQSHAAWDEAKLNYQQTALNAFQDVSNALISRVKLAESLKEQSKSVKAYEDAVEVSLERYVAGKASYFEVLEAQQQLYPAENTLVQIQLNQLLNIVQLYKALGGGWKIPIAG